MKKILYCLVLAVMLTACGGGPKKTGANQDEAPAPVSKLQSPASSQVREYYKVGDAVRKNGTIGVVFQVTDGGKHGKMVSIKKSLNRLPWSSDKNEQKRLIGANDEYDGAKNMEKVIQIDNWQYKYPAFAWCAALGEGWYLPAREELKIIYSVNHTFDNILDKTIDANGGDSLRFYLWSSTERDYVSQGGFCAWLVNVRDGDTFTNDKNDDYRVRAVSAF